MTVQVDASQPMNEKPQVQPGARWIRRSGQALFLLAIVAAGSGCQSGGNKTAAANANVPATLRYKVTADSTGFYHYGPEQPNGPDLSLKKDTEVTLVKHGFGYSEVTTPDGQTGYVGSEDITQMTAEDIAAANAAQDQLAQAATQKRSSAIVGEYTIPPEAGNDAQLPVADSSPTPKPTPTPPFRY